MAVAIGSWSGGGVAERQRWRRGVESEGFFVVEAIVFKKGRYAQRTGVEASVYLAAVLEYLATEVSLSDPKISLSVFLNVFFVISCLVGQKLMDKLK